MSGIRLVLDEAEIEHLHQINGLTRNNGDDSDTQGVGLDHPSGLRRKSSVPRFQDHYDTLDAKVVLLDLCV